MVEPPRCAQELTVKAVLVAALSLDTDVAADVLVSMVAVGLGSVIVASPHRAARIWGAQRLANLAPGAQSFIHTLVPDFWDCSLFDRRTPRG